MDLTTERIISLLPLSQEEKTKLSEDYQVADAGVKFVLENTLWDAYYAYYQIRLQENLQLEFVKLKEGKVQPDAGFFARVREATEKQLEDEDKVDLDQNELSSVREKLAAFIKD